MEVLTWWDQWGELVRTILVGISSIAVAYVGTMERQRKKDAAAVAEKIAEAEERRRKEKRLELAMQSANIKLTVGVAMALKHGHCNGEVESGLSAVREAEAAYMDYVKGVGLETILTRYKI